MIVIVILLLIVIIILGYDLWEDFFAWLGRIKVGQLSESEWHDKTRKILLKWIVKGAPEVRINDGRKINFIKKLNEYGKITSVTYWQDASLVKAASCMEENLEIEVKSLAERYIPSADGEWKMLPKRMDSAMLCYELMSSKYIDNDKIKPAMNNSAYMLKLAAEKHGSIPYNENLPKYRLVDTVGMACPFLIKYGNTYNEKEYIDIAIKQIKEYRMNGIDEKTKLPFHGFCSETHAPLGVCGWGRGCAWWAIGLTDSLRALLEVDGYNREKAELLKLTMEHLDTMKKYIRDDGTVERIVVSKSAQDSSACAMLAYCYAYMAELTKNDAYKQLAEKMIRKLRSVTRRNGIVDFSQGDTHGIGFYSEKLCIVPAAQGFAIAAEETANRSLDFRR